MNSHFQLLVAVVLGAVQGTLLGIFAIRWFTIEGFMKYLLAGFCLIVGLILGLFEIGLLFHFASKDDRDTNR
jgi:hypothetical protein